MNYLRFAGFILAHFAKVLTYQWILSLVELLRTFWRTLKLFFRRLKRPHPDREDADKDPCLTVDNPAVHRPDPCLYSQEYLLGLGLPVTWDNPDIAVLSGGVPVPENALEPDTDYEVDVTVWNNSYEAPALGLEVELSFLSFGVATETHPVGTALVDLGVKGGPNHPAHARIPWHTPATAGHFCLLARLDWFDDLNPANNVGQNNIDVAAPHSPATFSFALRNDTGAEDTFTFEVDAYTIPTQPDCPVELPRQRPRMEERLRRIRVVHDRALYPVPAGWDVDVVPPAVTLAPDQEVGVAVAITPPAGFAGRQPFNVNARHGSGYAGGVSLVVESA